ncbi:UDP-N-acetylglucosamine transferase subunit ALG14 [Pleurostoma richardsiae]|uniref:UDP-N-acetylglucosamine transferase subunit ALG14 n=1 Tax=Pleurostoma richardsiae TaxID=41990 RepID=A0AA38RTF2_9PEZI|nr:UDP-N-acetylglucosamine transferase subunit ALG14 [Pleurostoma richardsiae]
MISVYGRGGQYATAIGAGVILIAIASLLSLFYIPLWVTASALSMLAAFVFTRHFSVRMGQKKTAGRVWMAASDKYPGPDTSKLPAVYFLYVLGSGGHTTEMVEMIKHKFRGSKNLHRRYLITTGDRHSQNKELELEAIIHDAYVMGTGGTYDTMLVTRARAVHQSFFTSIFTTLMCAFEIIAALTMIPEKRPKDQYGEAFRYPHVIVTNGPGTGFIVCLVAQVLKIFYLAPENRLKMVYVESWARIKSLSLTGKLFYWTDIADLFVVQSDSLSKVTGKPNVGNVSMRTTPVGLDYGRREAWPGDYDPHRGSSKAASARKDTTNT